MPASFPAVQAPIVVGYPVPKEVLPEYKNPRSSKVAVYPKLSVVLPEYVENSKIGSIINS